MKQEIIIDTDPGNDDVLAIMLAERSAMFNIRALTTVAGNTTIENVTKNARYVLRLLGREDIPVYSGASKPLKRELRKAVVHGSSGLGNLKFEINSELSENAVEKILSIVKENPHKITIIALGPLTNIAMAINKDPQTMSKVKEIAIMGGAINVPGNVSPFGEFNFYVDPEAADMVFKFPFKKILLPLDACNHVKLYMKDFEEITDPKLRAPILTLMEYYINAIMEDEGIAAALMYDPLTVYSLMNPSACIKKEYNVMVETKGELTRGMSVADLRIKPSNKPNVTVIERVSEKDFKRDFIKYLSQEK